MKIDEIITAANKREIRTSINDWLKSELSGEARLHCEAVARQYMKEHKDVIDALIRSEMDRIVPKLAKEFTNKIKRNFDSY